MEGRVGSGVLKKKSSYGCLIIKKAGANKNSGGGLGDLCDSSKGKKRARLVESGSDSSSSSSDEDESLEFMRRKVNEKRLKKGSAGYKRNEVDNAGIDASGEKKRSRLDLFEFDEYDEFDEKKMRNEFLQDKFKSVGRKESGNVKKSSVSSNRNLVVDKRKQGSYFDGSSSGKSKGVGGSGTRNKGFGSDDDEAHMPISLLKEKYQETAGESIRLQGKNGVLKVMVNKKKRMDFSSQAKNHDAVEKDLSEELPVYPNSKISKNPGLIAGKERSSEKEKGEIKLEKVSNKERKARDSGVAVTDRPQACSSKKALKKEVERSPSIENSLLVKGKEGREGNVKRGGGSGGSTEKQMLREKIRAMLIDAGWSIDYRPRRNRDYLDAVYISPSGTAYWSIIKAYDAFKKQLEEDDDKAKANIGSPSFAPLSEDLINKLTRQTKKKIAEEMKRKRKEDGMAKSAKKSAVKEAEESSDSDQSGEQLSSYKKQNQKPRGQLSKVDQDSDDDLSDDSLNRKPRKSNPVQGRTSKVIGRCTLLVRGSNRGDNSDFDGYVPYRGKRTVLAWLIDCGTAKLSEKVQYMNRRRTRVMLEGWITRDGIHCGCCSKILTVSKFELHAGSKLRQPFQNIFLESGSSLLQCQIDAWNSQEEPLHRDFFTVDVDGDDPDDDTCGICGDGGDLICCDSCPSTFHQICLGIQILPLGDWHCPNCTCKFCGLAGGNMTEENNVGCNELNRCNFCEKKYHKSCSEKVHAQPKSSYSSSFCGLKCQEIYDHLQKILGIKHELEAGISWSLIQRTDTSDASQRGYPLRVECNSKLAVALSVMDECFLPIIDRRSRINIIHNVVYNCGSNFNRLNYRGFYTAILERGDEIIAAASIRLHGDRLAEMPFIGTREIYRRQGMCRRLLSAIETELSSLEVGQLIIPAISEHMNTWTTVFGFDELEDEHKKEIKSMNMLVFPGTDMLQKQLVEQENSDGFKVSESTKNQPRLPVLVEKVDVSSSGEQNGRASSDSGRCPMSKTCDEVDAVNSGSPVPAIPSDGLREADNRAPDTSVAVCESYIHLPCQEPTACLPEMENKQKESSDNSKCSPVPAEDSNISSEEHRLLEPPAEDDSNSLVKAIVEDASKTKTEDSADEHRLLEAPTEDDSNSPVKSVVEEQCKTADSADEHRLLESPAEDDSNSLVKAVVEDACKTENSADEHRLLEPPAEENSNNSMVKAVVAEDACKTEDSADAPGIENGIPAVSEKASQDASQSKPISNGCVESFPGSVSEVSAEVNAGNGEECIMADADSDHKALDAKADGVDPGVVQDAPDRAKTDKPEGECNRSSLADGDVGRPVSPCQAMAQNPAAAENHIR
ncbi:hypothetical protein C2S51_013872 [Perilla frutescens var. frutescens]|nr:hypothetical protein C2S51_013872 [Perilla frutescens var. frutescens]